LELGEEKVLVQKKKVKIVVQNHITKEKNRENRTARTKSTLGTPTVIRMQGEK
jgi:hypothetical protein